MLAAQGADAVDHAETSLDDARRLLAGRNVTVDFVSDLGDPGDRLVALADERAADLIVVGSGKSGFLERLFEGSVSDDVSRHTRRDVLIVH